MKQRNRQDRPRSFVLLASTIFAASLLVGCATGLYAGPRFSAMSESEHLQAACALKRRAQSLEKKFDPSARRLLVPERSSSEPSGMPASSGSRGPEYYNPTYHYLVKARDLRRQAQRHLAAAGRRDVAKGRVCATLDRGFRSYGKSWFMW